MALFPAEVLVSLYRTLGDVRDVLVGWRRGSTILLILAAVTILLLALAGLRRRRYAILRALGASRSYILLTVWLGASLVLTAGCVADLAPRRRRRVANRAFCAAEDGVGACRCDRPAGSHQHCRPDRGGQLVGAAARERKLPRAGR